MEGDVDAFAALVDRHGPDAYRLATAILGPADAHDATQDALLSAWRQLPRLRQPDRFLPWLRRITVNRCRDLLRQSKRRVQPLSLDAEEALPEIPAGGADFRVTIEHREILDRAFEALTADQRSVLALHYSADLSIRDAARVLRIPAGTAKSRLNSALRALRVALEATEVRRG
ncbi:MAG: RNA polymerase sigma factor [Candidatus Limnocylindria bacterium]